MKIKTLAVLLQINLVLFLSGCNLIEGVFNYGNPPGISEDNPFSSVNFPLESCSDSLPEDESAYPLELYTVFTVDSNIDQQIQEKYCQRTSLGDIRDNSPVSETMKAPATVTGIGTFIGRKRAEQFKEILSLDFDNIKISQPLTITSPESLLNSPDSPTNLKTPEEIADAALLNPVQLSALLEIDRSKAFGRGRRDNQYQIKVVLPTYIPQGFELEMFEVKNYERYGNEYRLLYRNFNNNQCFSFRGGFIMPIGSPASFSTVIDANSPALGLTPIVAFSSDRLSSQVSGVGFHTPEENRDFGQFTFGSSSHLGESCQVMNFVEAVKVAESFQFLQP